MEAADDRVLVRVHGSAGLPTLIYLPGIHGDWTLITSMRRLVSGRLRFVELSYPRTTSWSIEDYAAGIEEALKLGGITDGWLLGESFGSQPAWEMIARRERGVPGLKIHGLILAGGFVKHPWPWGARLLRRLTQHTPRWGLRAALGLYGLCAAIRHRKAPDTRQEIADFIRNRLHPEDPAAWLQRYTIVAESDVRPVAEHCRLPVFQLSGLVDAIVPAVLVRRWLQKRCPTFVESKTIFAADHNVLATAPEASVETVLRWMARKEIDAGSALKNCACGSPH